VTRLPAAVVVVGLAAVVEYATTGTVGTGTFAVVVAVTLIAAAMREGRLESARETERSTEEREKAVAPAQDVRENGTEYGKKKRGKA